MRLALEAKGYVVKSMTFEQPRQIGSSTEDFSWVEGGWFITVDPPTEHAGDLITGTDSRMVLEYVALLTDLNGGKG